MLEFKKKCIFLLTLIQPTVAWEKGSTARGPICCVYTASLIVQMKDSSWEEVLIAK